MPLIISGGFFLIFSRVKNLQIFYWGTSLLANARRRRRAIPSYANSTDVKGRTTSETTVFDLKPYTSYTMAIKAFNSGGEGPASDEIDLATLQDGMFKQTCDSLICFV